MHGVGRFVRVSVFVAGMAIAVVAAPLSVGATASQSTVSAPTTAHASLDVAALKANTAALEATLRLKAAELRAALGG
ncbi:MAG TPA: hypothetical protein VFX03_06330 [Thermomicrobiales bacterium]|nr:hypothetical protein [Thermomicrobiales bacterium]